MLGDGIVKELPPGHLMFLSQGTKFNRCIISNHLQMGEFPLFARVCREKTNCTQSSIKMERVLHVSPHLPFGSQSWQLNICHK